MEFSWKCDDCGRDMTLEQAQCNCWWNAAHDDNAVAFADDVS